MLVSWWMKCPEKHPVEYGARAIYQMRSVPVQRKNRGNHTDYKTEIGLDFLRDRCSLHVDDGISRFPFIDWLNGKALRQLKKRLLDEGIPPNSDAVIEIHDGKYHLTASPNASYGYLYVNAWQE